MKENNMNIHPAKYIEHTNVKPNATDEDIIRLVLEAEKYEFHGVCINSYYVSLANKIRKNNNIKIIQTLGFPFGINSRKYYEVNINSDEVDMVMNVSALKSKLLDDTINDIRRVRNACGNKYLKVIIETALLTREEIKIACELVEVSGADMIKTNTGFFERKRGLFEDTKLIQTYTKLPVKAAGGIRDYDVMLQLINMGVKKIGTSSGIKIIGEYNERKKINRVE